MIEGPKGDRWKLAEDLRVLAQKLIETYPDELSYIDLAKVMFVRAENLPPAQKWLGKCYLLRAPYQMILQYGAALLGNPDAMEEVDLRYIIVLNEDLLAQTRGPADKILAGVIFHEMKHIDPDMEKIVRHDIQDFASLLDKFGVHWTEGEFKDDGDMGVVESE